MTDRIRLARVAIDGRLMDLDRAPTIPFARPIPDRPRIGPPRPLPADVALALDRIGYRTFPVAEAVCGPDKDGAA